MGTGVGANTGGGTGTSAHEAETGLEAYTRIVAEIANGGGDRAVVLARHGLDEDRWDAIDDAWQARLSDAADQASEDEGVPPLVVAYAEALTRAQRERTAGRAVIAFDRFAEAVRLLRRDGNMLQALARTGLTIDQFLQANQHWTACIVNDPELARRFEAIVG